MLSKKSDCGSDVLWSIRWVLSSVALIGRFPFALPSIS